MTAGPDDERAADLARRLEQVRDRIAVACRASGRAEEEVTLVGVTKTFPAEDVARLVRLGLRDIGENRDQEAAPKVEAATALLGSRDFTVHFIGQLQTNKAGHVAGYADHVHSVDRVRLVGALSRGAENAGRRLGVLVQVSLDEGAGRGGASPADVPALCDAVAGAAGLHLDGLMAVAPLGEEPGAAFARLAELAGRVRADHPGATWLSAGMSSDLEAAIEHGATHLRVGTAILHSRPSHR